MSGPVLGPPTPEDLERAWPLLSKAWEIGKWAVGFLAALFFGAKWASRFGSERQKYEVLREDVDELKIRSACWLTKDEHDDQQRTCQKEIGHIIDAKVREAVMGLHDEMGVLNGNLCRIMGVLNIDPIESARRRRRED